MATTEQKYFAGYFQIEYVDEKHYRSFYELYFKDDKNEEIYKIEQKSKPLSNAPLLPESKKELAEEKIITFEIPEPSQAERDVYSSDISLKNIFESLFQKK